MDPTNIHGAAPGRRLATCAMGSLALAAWLLRHPFAGMNHDSLLYTLFALARLHPDTVGADVVARFGSQDRFTLFTPVYTAAIQLFGIERAALLLLVMSQAVLLTCAWLLARRFMTPLNATLGLALLAVVPGEYGSGDVFHLLENFLTPRMPAEALVVAAVLAALSARYWIGTGCVAAAILIHPIMGAAGAVFLILCLVPPRLALILTAAGFAIALGVVLALAPLGRLTDPDWARAVSTEAPYLFLLNWSMQDWSRVAIPLVLLALGWRAGSTPLLRRVCASALGMVACGMAINLVFVDLLHVWLAMSLQAWRWLWLADLLAFLLAPAILLHRTEWSRHTRAAAIAVIVLGGCSCVWLMTRNWPSYATVYYPPKLADLFAPWRAAMAPRAEVLWPDTALAAWYLLERPSYWSTQQVAGGLFSREQANIMERRTQLVRAAMRDSAPLPAHVARMDSEALRRLCADPELQYVVGGAQLADSPFPPINGKFYLYRCADLRAR